MEYDDHDPWNEPSHRHPRNELMHDEILWDCVNELAPFGSDGEPPRTSSTAIGEPTIQTPTYLTASHGFSAVSRTTTTFR